MSIYRMSEKCAVAGQIIPDDVTTLAVEGYTTVICNRPDGEEYGQPLASDVAAACEEHGIVFHNIPIDRSGLTQSMVDSFRDAVVNSDGLALAYCRSGQRSAVIWQASGSP